MKPGQLVLLIQVDDYMPPIYSIGIITMPIDEMGDHEVYFADCPCPVQEITWSIPAPWLLPLDDWTTDDFAENIDAAVNFAGW